LGIEPAGEVVEFPAHMLIGKPKKFSHVCRPNFAHRSQQAIDHRTEHFFRLQIKGRTGQSWVTAEQYRSAQ
jgi:hypothetical protein